MHTALTVLLWFVIVAVGIWILFVAAYLSAFIHVGKSLGKAFDKPLTLDGPVFPNIERRTVLGSRA